ncbi:hypothetical protein [Psychroserpens burtonensis]|uniref:hypothetical protein n=1 Tax=Psychroserpens burtonensis TaxID=49278 RepID=UPI00041FF213|nr:hypothetical protein [Psychroserpens burtonensis]
MQQNTLLNIDESARNSLIENLKKELELGSDNLNKICQAIQKVGVPKYYPKYMVQHGIKAFLEKEDNGLNEKFDKGEFWRLALKDYLHCGE